MGVWVVRAVGRRRGWRETAELAAGWLDPHLGEFDNVPAPDETLPMGGGGGSPWVPCSTATHRVSHRPQSSTSPVVDSEG